ncbi:MAG TPA: acyl-CoA dehydrogenase family protein [Solirubrobacteraceae bacterium]|nr:acyl-CoA dehydrogenase family protein [Solirubrobacteraceae bacterium]
MATEAAGPGVAEVTAEADAFAAELATRIAGEDQLRWQGMPSDGDSLTAYAALGKAGWIGLHWPEHLGGRGLTPLHTVACEERFGYHWLPLSGYLLSVKTIGNALGRFASPALQERLLPEIAAGRLVFCQGFSEPDSGSDLASLRTTAVDHGDRFVVSGRKLWTSSAEVADWIYLAVRTGPGERHRGLSVLVAPVDCPGVTVSTHDTLGGGTIGEVVLEDVEISHDQLVGGVGGGWSVLMGTLDHERVTSEKVGVVMWLLDQLDDVATTRADRARLLRLRGEAEAARLHGRRAAELLWHGHPASEQSSMAKLAVAVLMQRLAAAAVEISGPAGLLEEGTGTLPGRIAAFHRAAVATTISGGAAEVQRLVIARRGLGCPA